MNHFVFGAEPRIHIDLAVGYSYEKQEQQQQIR
jgi:hypothetical protein